MTNRKLIEIINEIEAQVGSIPVRERLNDEWGNYFLSDLPGHLAIRHFCKLLRCKLRYEPAERRVVIR
jgi:hypothetical protein